MRVRCPHCHGPIELLDDSSFTEIDCPSCGSRFNLAVDAATATFRQEGDNSIGHFQLIEKLGVGHFGTVWKAKDTELDRTVAIKVPRKDQLSESEREQFIREARAAAQLRHPHIVTVHEVGREDGTIYIASDYVQGADLQEWLTGQRLTPRETAELCRKVAEALHHAHQQGVVHRDLKPGNIMLDLEGEPHIMDFGLAKRDAGEITMTMDGQILGTPAYMSPEQARGEGHQADRRADIYSLGVILYELLTGELPFRGDKRMLIVQILTDEPTPPRRIDSGVPRDLETICIKCLEKAPGKRYATAQELADDLGRFLRGEAILARPIGRCNRGWRWCRRNPAVALLTGTVAVSLFVGIAVSGYFAIEANYFAKESNNRATDLERSEKDLRDERNSALRLAAEKDKLATDAFAARRLAEQRLTRAERLLYVSHIARAQSRWESGHVAAAWESLDACRWDFRGWEHDYLYTLFNSNQQTFMGHTGSVSSVAFSPDGRRIVSGSDDKTLKVWDAASGQEAKAAAKRQQTPWVGGGVF